VDIVPPVLVSVSDVVEVRYVNVDPPLETAVPVMGRLVVASVIPVLKIALFAVITIVWPSETANGDVHVSISTVGCESITRLEGGVTVGESMTVKPVMLDSTLLFVVSMLNVTAPEDPSTPMAAVLSVTVVAAPAAMVPPLRVRVRTVAELLMAAELNVGVPPASETA
jgi:hypothetical protein